MSFRLVKPYRKPGFHLFLRSPFTNFVRMKSYLNIGIVGLGKRGLATLRRYRHLSEQAHFVALCDIQEQNCLEANLILSESGRDEAKVLSLHEMCQSTEIDLVYVCTNWESHAEIAIKVLECGKDVALEIPAATDLSDCQRLKEAAERSKGRVLMLENCCFDPFHLGMMGMVKAGILGEISHLEGAYIHYLGERAAVGYAGNPYPTHGIGPICQLLGDDKLVGISSINGGNSVSHSLLKTEKGRSVLLQFDETTPRPYSRMQTLCGTKGFVQKYPLPTVQIESEVYAGDKALDYVSQYIDSAYQSLIDEGSAKGVENIMNYVMDRRVMDSLIHDEPFEISLDEALTWSSIISLSAQSALADGQWINLK